MRLFQLVNDQPVGQGVKLISCNISESMSEIGTKYFATIKTLITLDSLSGDFALIDQDLIIFSGKILTSNNKNEYSLIVINPKSPTNLSTRIFEELEYPFRPVDRQGIMYSAENLLQLEIQNLPEKKLNVDLNIRWVKYVPEIMQIGSDERQINTLTPKSLLSNWPMNNILLSSWNVLKSNIKVLDESWMKYKEGFIQQTRLETDLILTRIATLITNEKWEIEIGDSDISEEVKLSLDLTGYTVPHTHWGSNHSYVKGHRITILKDNQEYEFKVCKIDHTSGNEFAVDEDKWEAEIDYDTCAEEVLFRSHFGRDILVCLIGNLKKYVLINMPKAIFRATGIWETWKSLRIGDLVRFNTKDGEVITKVIKCDKKYEYRKGGSCKEITFEAHSQKLADSEGVKSEYWDAPITFAYPPMINDTENILNGTIKMKNTANIQFTQEKIEPTILEVVSQEAYFNSASVKFKCLLDVPN